VDMSSGGSADDGTKVFFRLKLAGGVDQTMIIEQEKLGPFLLGLMRFGALAQKDRRRLLGDSGPAQLYPTQSPAVAPGGEQGVALRLGLAPEFGLDFHLSPEVARGLLQQLQRALDGSAAPTFEGPAAH